jgi:undecaprenyl-diphosphatase
MLEHLIELDRSLFLALNGFHSPFFDRIMIVFSERAPWIPLYAAIVFTMFFTIKGYGFRESAKQKFKLIRKPIYFGIIALSGALITFALSDTIAYQIKLIVERPRPAYDPIIGNMVRMLEYKGGVYGFLSNHATNVFGMAVFTSQIFKKISYTVFIFLWAIMVSYSRIYVGKHFPLDVFCGAILGLFIGILIYYAAQALLRRYTIKIQKSDVIRD